jgi:hypothetical protein
VGLPEIKPIVDWVAGARDPELFGSGRPDVVVPRSQEQRKAAVGREEPVKLRPFRGCGSAVLAFNAIANGKQEVRVIGGGFEQDSLKYARLGGSGSVAKNFESEAGRSRRPQVEACATHGEGRGETSQSRPKGHEEGKHRARATRGSRAGRKSESAPWRFANYGRGSGASC